MKKELLICFNIRGVERATKKKPARMLIEFDFPHYLKESQKMGNDLIDKLLQQSILFSDVKIKGLSLVWNED